MLGVGEVLADRYELEALLGTGGMSVVYRARDRDLDRTVAVKVLHESLMNDSDVLGRFRREAETAAGLAHENIVAVIDRGEADGRPFIVFEHVPGANLKQILNEAGPLPVDRALGFAIQIAHGLAHAHARGTIHRDVKPHNVLIDAEGRAKLTDFGIARSSSRLESSTLAGTVLGSVDYIAPEQAQGQPVEVQSDVYSLGVVLHELLTGELPFTGESFVEVALQHINDEPPVVGAKRAGIPRRVEAALRRALAKRPEERFATVAAFASELEAARRELPAGVAETGAEPAAQLWGEGDTVALSPRAAPRRVESARLRPGRRLTAGLVLLGAGALVAGALVLLPRRVVPRIQMQGAEGAVGPSAGLRALAPYDPPPGDGVEDNQRLPYATDGNAATAWSTEWYASAHFGGLKSGVGIVFAVGRPLTLTSLTVLSDTPGFAALVEDGPGPAGPFRAISSPTTIRSRTTFKLTESRASRYYLLWITDLPLQTGPRFHADINEVTAVAT